MSRLKRFRKLFRFFLRYSIRKFEIRVSASSQPLYGYTFFAYSQKTEVSQNRSCLFTVYAGDRVKCFDQKRLENLVHNYDIVAYDIIVRFKLWTDVLKMQISDDFRLSLNTPYLLFNAKLPVLSFRSSIDIQNIQCI